MLHSGDTLAHFSIVKPLGEGGMGEVYLAEDTKLNRQVALKTLRDDFFDNSDRRDRFEREARTAAQITHSNVMSIYDTGVATAPDSGKEIHYIVMELVQGKPLDEWVAGHKSEIAKLLRVAEAIGAGIAAAHKLNIVHRDIKSDNIIVTEEDEPKILDFGLAKPVDPLQASEQPISGETVKQELTKVGTVIGTVSYMSPEQARGETVDARSDIFSFGVLLYKMFSGEMPFTGSSQVSILAKILESPHPQISSIRGDIDPEIERIINKCLHKDANDRYQDIRDLVVDLRNLRRSYDSGISTTVSGVAQRSDVFAAGGKDSKSKVFFLRGSHLLIAAVVVVLILGYVFWPGGRKGTNTVAQAQEYSLAILSFDNRTGDVELDWLETGLPEILLTDLAQGQAIRLISHRRILEALGGEGRELSEYSRDDQFRAAADLGAVHVISGTIYKQGEKFRISTQLEEVSSGDVLMGENVVGSDPFDLVDSLTVRVASSLKMSDDQFTDHGISQLTTENANAYKYYHLGMDAFLKNNYDRARELLHKAITEDSSFAMPYLRIGMAYVFDGKQQESLPYFQKAKQLEHHLPLRDRGLLDVYAELWLSTNLDAAMTKLETLVSNYPDDPEALAVLAIMRWQLLTDTTGAIDAIERSRAADPTFPLTNTFAYQIYRGAGMDDKALEEAQNLRKSLPDSPAGYNYEADQYIDRGEYSKAISTLEAMLAKFPNYESGYTGLVNLYTREREFKKASEYVEKFGEQFKDDPYKLISYAHMRANLANWEGRFLDDLVYRHDALKYALETGDSNHIASSLTTLGSYSSRLGRRDSALVYFDRALEYVQNFGMRSSIPISIAEVDPKRGAELREYFEGAVEDFRARVPANLFFVATALEKMFNGRVKSDTALYLEGNREILQLGQSTSTNERELGITLIQFRKYEEGISHLLPYVEGKDFSSSGYHYPLMNYYLGVAYDQLGKKQEAIARFEEMLRYWGKPQIELDEIKDARKRLAALRS